MRTVLLLAALLASPLASAQTNFGLKVGVNAATVSGDTEGADLSSRLGFVAGGFLQFAVSPSLGIQPEVNFSQKGFKLMVEGAEATAKADYIEVPLLGVFRIPTNSALEIGVMAGPTLGIKVSEGVSATDGDVTIDMGTDLFSSTDFGVAFGASVGSGPFGVDVRYTLGLSDVDPDGVSNLHNRVISATGFYRFGGN